MNKQEFKVGDKVRKVDGTLFHDGQEWSYIKSTRPEFGGCDIGCSDGYYYIPMYLTTNPKIHPHHDIIIAWLNGEEVEYFLESDRRWYAVDSITETVGRFKSFPPFSTWVKYRIKPTKSEQELEMESEILRLEKIINDAKESIEKLKEMK